MEFKLRNILSKFSNIEMENFVKRVRIHCIDALATTHAQWITNMLAQLNGNRSFRPRVVSALSRFGPGSFRPGSFRPELFRP